MTEENQQSEQPVDGVVPGPAVAEPAPSNDGAAEPKTALEEITTKKGKADFKTIASAEIKPGMVVRVHQKIVETNPKGEEKERIQVFQGMVIARKHGREDGATITVRKVSEGVGVERIFPLALPSIAKFELVRQFRVRQARPYFLRTYKKKLSEL